MLSSSSYGLIQLILSNRVTENANKILGRKILPGSFSVLSHVSLARFAWRMPGGIVHWPFGLQQLLLKVVSLPIFSTDLSLQKRSQRCL